jgi:hypothetical protein
MFPRHDEPQVFLDLDGVLADFDALATELFGCSPAEFQDRRGPREFWRRITAHGSFYADLPLMPDAMELWAFCCSVGTPTILSGVPRGKWAAPQKIDWVQRHLDTDRVITCTAKKKCEHAQAGDILVDDMLKYRALWEGAGGVFIHHVSAESSMEQLRSLL